MKDCIYSEDLLVPYLSMKLGRPIKWLESRQENILSYHGRGQSLAIEMAVKNDGTILGMRGQVVADQVGFVDAWVGDGIAEAVELYEKALERVE